MYILFQVSNFHKSILLIVQYKYLKSSSEDFILKNPTKIWLSAQDRVVLLLLLNIVGFFISTRKKSAWQKWFVPQLYLLRRGILEGPALKYFYMIHRGGRPLGFCHPVIVLWERHNCSQAQMLGLKTVSFSHPPRDIQETSCVALCCTVLHCVALCCTVLQCDVAFAVSCSAMSRLQCVAVRSLSRWVTCSLPPPSPFPWDHS